MFLAEPNSISNQRIFSLAACPAAVPQVSRTSPAPAVVSGAKIHQRGREVRCDDDDDDDDEHTSRASQKAFTHSLQHRRVCQALMTKIRSSSNPERAI